MSIKTRVSFGEVPVIRHTDELVDAAAQLATERCAYVLPSTIESPDGPLTNTQGRVAALLGALNDQHPWWTAKQFRERTVTAETDLGMHGNPPNEEDDNIPGQVDYLQYHHTPKRTATAQAAYVVTFALARPAYEGERDIANPLLTAALREGETYPRYAEVDTFQRATVYEGDSVVFRLNNQTTDGLCLLHDFLTVADTRDIEFTALERWTSEAAAEAARG